ncbi:MFS transporter [Streptomyces poriferorum]|uniref:MFS transporter n=1 Tax=Streptomyces poriferorum TaxID=2798799 RepID=A0ABY9IGQ1_9ACTN|nr:MULTISPECIES: MFS transporter [Streptomyces]MBW5251631.1 MFS transporter [Streptomyces poriferorum]MBW5259901.1 MFS transporter [Streptomyces poriferorum]MDP5316021.1 MFS transporter [Streptomyces sp. Alt4]WLQ52876.1 MFS transporter [Streptomyces sp. Alt1]WLQ54363.1 MFS transporter [Streptomyces sp. Alt2]
MPKFLPPVGPQRTLSLAQLTNSVGDGAYYVTSALYFTHVVGLAPARIGLGLTVAWAVGSLVGVPLGRIADRRGPRGTAVVLALATGAAVASFLVVRDFALFLAAACLYATAQSGLAAARQALLAGLVAKEERTGALAHLQSTLNAGLAVGAALGGLALSAGTTAAYLAVFSVDAASFLLSALVLLRLPPVAAVPGDRGAKLAVLRDRPYAVVTLLNAVLLIRMPLLSVGLPLWITERTEAPEWVVSALFVLNTGAVMLFQVRTARFVNGISTAARAIRRSGALMVLTCLVLAMSAVDDPWLAVTALAGGSVLLVAAEMLHSAGSWQLSFDLAPAGRIGEYQGFFGTGVTVARTLGPLLLTMLLVGRGTAGWLLLGGVVLAASYALGPAARWAAGTRQEPDAVVVAQGV